MARVMVVFGGRSREHEVSLSSARAIIEALRGSGRHEVIPVGITPSGRWISSGDPLVELETRGTEASDGAGLPAASEKLPAISLGSADVVFPVLHGPYGEDGTIQGLLEMAGIPYVGSGVLASAAAMDKAVAKTLLRGAGLAVADAVVVRRLRWDSDPGGCAREVARLGLPVFVKPARGGSSIGISRVTAAADLEVAVEDALRCDPKILVEAAVPGREIECGVLDGPHGPQASVPAEVRVVGDYDFYDFEAKYLDTATELTVPADLPAEVTGRLQEAALAAFTALGCEGLARVDFFVGDDGSLVVNEVNTMPGFTATSMFPRMWAASGLDYPALVDRLVTSALRRGTGLH